MNILSVSISTLFLLLLNCYDSHSYNFLILGVYPYSSHVMMLSTIGEGLALKGHNVTYVTLKTTKTHPKVDVIRVDNPLENVFTAEFLNECKTGSAYFVQRTLFDYGLIGSENALSSDVLQKLIQTKIKEESTDLFEKKYDAVITETHFTKEPFAAGFAQKYDCPIINYQPLHAPSYAAYMIGEPYNPAYMVDYKMRFIAKDMTFYQRLQNFLLSSYQVLYLKYIYLPKQDKIMRKHFASLGANNWPYIGDIIQKRQALTLVDSHPIISDSLPHNPNVIDVGGLQIKQRKPLPQDIEQFVNSSKHGVIFFAMGSMVDAKNLDPKTRDVLIQVLGSLKENVIWKLDDTELSKTLPKNIKMGKWWPQNDILAHPNCKLFMNHGGVHSTLESLYHGVPMMIIPFFADQTQNGLKAIDKGFGEMLQFTELNVQELDTKINKILNNPSYKQNALKLSKILKSERLHPLDLATSQIEYVLRHNGATHLRTRAAELTWYQYLLIDVLVLFIISIVIVIYIVYKLVNIIIHLFNNENKLSNKKKNLNKSKKNK